MQRDKANKALMDDGCALWRIRVIDKSFLIEHGGRR